MFGIGWTEFIIIALVLLIFIGPRNLPKLLQKLGSLYSEIRTAGRELNNQIATEVRDLEKEIGPLRSPAQAVRSVTNDFLKELPPTKRKLKNVKNSVRKEIQKIDAQLSENMSVKQQEPDVKIEKSNQTLVDTAKNETTESLV